MDSSKSKITKKLKSRFIGIIQLSQELILNRYGHVPEAQVCGVHSGNTSYRFVEIFNFRHFASHITFDPAGDFGRNKQIKDYVIVSVVLALECGNTSIMS